jgi:hypothetical protein
MHVTNLSHRLGIVKVLLMAAQYSINRYQTYHQVCSRQRINVNRISYYNKAMKVYGTVPTHHLKQ